MSRSTTQSAEVGYVIDQMHEINWKEAEVVDSHLYYRQRYALEAQDTSSRSTRQWTEMGPSTIRVQPGNPSVEVGCSQTVCEHHRTFPYYIPFLHSKLHLTLQAPAIFVYKNACHFCNIIFLHWWPRIGSKRLNEVALILFEIWLVKFPQFAWYTIYHLGSAFDLWHQMIIRLTIHRQKNITVCCCLTIARDPHLQRKLDWFSVRQEGIHY